MGARVTPEDTASTRFGTVRPRVQIPGPRPNPYSKSTIRAAGRQPAQGPWTIVWTTVHECPPSVVIWSW